MRKLLITGLLIAFSGVGNSYNAETSYTGKRCLSSDRLYQLEMSFIYASSEFCSGFRDKSNKRMCSKYANNILKSELLTTQTWNAKYYYGCEHDMLKYHMNKLSTYMNEFEPYKANHTPFTYTHSKRGCCSNHGGVCGCTGSKLQCCDGKLSPSCKC